MLMKAELILIITDGQEHYFINY